MTTRTPRAISRTIQVLESASQIRDENDDLVDAYAITAEDRDACLKALRRTDQRTRLDPSARKGFRPKKRPAAKKSAKRGPAKSGKKRARR